MTIPPYDHDKVLKDLIEDLKTIGCNVTLESMDMEPKETFFQFLTRKSGFGRTSWPVFIFMQTLLAGFVIAGALDWRDGGWIGIAVWVVINAALVLGSWMNYTGRWK